MTPKLLKTSLTFSFLILSITASFGQLENPEKKVEVPVDLIQPNIEVEKHDFIDPRITDETKVEAALAKIIKDMLNAEEKAQLKNKGITTAEKIREERAKKKMGELNKNYAKIDQYLGGYSTTGDHIIIVCWDFMHPDGDIVTIYLNDQPVIQNIILTNEYQQFRLPLVEGLNVISFNAENQGFAGPNTAALRIFDEEAREILAKGWNLATGAKATLSIARVDEE